MEKKHVMSLQGRDYVTWEGLLDHAHNKGLVGIRTKLVQVPDEINQFTAIVEAVATFEGGREFAGIGDANPGNVNKAVAKHLIRMAETRAKARALRDGTNVGMTAFDELDTEAEEPITQTQIDALWGALRSAHGEEAETVWRTALERRGMTSTKELGAQQAEQAIAYYRKLAAQKEAA